MGQGWRPDQKKVGWEGKEQKSRWSGQNVCSWVLSKWERGQALPLAGKGYKMWPFCWRMCVFSCWRRGAHTWLSWIITNKQGFLPWLLSPHLIVSKISSFLTWTFSVCNIMECHWTKEPLGHIKALLEQRNHCWQYRTSWNWGAIVAMQIQAHHGDTVEPHGTKVTTVTSLPWQIPMSKDSP